MAVTEVAAVPDANAATLVAKTICLSVRGGVFGNSRKGTLAAVETDADKQLLRLSKTLLVSTELDAVNKFDNETGGLIRKVAYPSMFKGGIHLVSVAQVEMLENMLRERATQRETLVTIAVNAYETRRDETITRLKSQYSAADYPGRAEYASKFYFEWTWVSFDTPTRLKAISAAFFEQEREKWQAQLQSVADECRQAMRAGLQELVEHMVDRLTPNADGKPKKFKSSLVTNMQEFLNTFELRDVTDDAELAEVVKRARAVMQGVDADVLRGDALVRQSMVGKLSELKAAIDPMVIEVADRAISFDDEVV